jgi:two-component system, NtrC family, response regulator AtoC
MAKARIMVVEDEQITAADIEDILNSLGYEVVAICSTGADAIQQAEQTHPDLVLMDIRIKGNMDGTEAAQEIRQRFDIPVVYLTAHADLETLERAKSAEPLGYIVKPYQDVDLQATIQMALHKQAMDRKAKERAAHLAATLGALTEGVICLDEMGRITYMNAAGEEGTGWKQRDALGRDVGEVFKVINRKDRSPVEGSMMQALRRGRLLSLSGDSVLVRKNGTEYPITGHATSLRDPRGRVAGAVILFGQQVPRSQPPAPGVGGQRVFDTGGVEMVAESPTIRDLVRFAHRVAASGVSTIVIQGETGTGKDVLARFIHHHSQRSEKPFVAINCAAVPDALLESELFGFEKGAFTDARAQKKGILELANGGTVLLDEIGELQVPLQAKLLRVLEDQSFRRLGGLRDVDINVRVIAATNQNLGEAVREGRFREDLFYRLNVITMEIPPLRERTQDIRPLVKHFIEIYNEKFGHSIKGVSPETLDKLLAHSWPGNVRELRNTIERAMVLEETDLIRPGSLGLGMASLDALESQQSNSSPPVSDGLSLGETEKAMLTRALEKFSGNQTQAARALGISRDTLRYRMKKHSLR